MPATRNLAAPARKAGKPAKPERKSAAKPTKASSRMPASASGPGGSAEVDERIATTDDWRGETLARLRKLIRSACPDVEEAVKWRKPSNPAGVVVWSKEGILCTGETYKGYAKLTFMHGAALPDPKGLFNAGLNGGTRRAIDLREGEMVDAAAFKDLVRAAVDFNQG